MGNFLVAETLGVGDLYTTFDAETFVGVGAFEGVVTFEGVITFVGVLDELEVTFLLVLVFDSVLLDAEASPIVTNKPSVVTIAILNKFVFIILIIKVFNLFRRLN